MRLLCITLLTGMLLGAGEHHLKNSHLQVTIDSAGGRITGLSLLPDGAQLTAVDGLLGDDFWNISESELFLNRCEYEVLPEPDSFSMRARQTGGGIDFLELGKVIRLSGAMVEVDYTFTNLPAAMSSREYGFRSRNFTGGRDGKPKHWYFPLMNGIKREDGSGASFSYYRQPSRGWLAFADSDGNGLAITMDYQHLDQFYGWYGEPSTTQEFRLDKLLIPSGESMTTRICLIPFRGLAQVSGAGSGMVGNLTVSPESGREQKRRIEAKIYSALRQQVKIELRVRRLRGGSMSVADTATADFSAPGQLRQFEFSFTFPDSPGLYEFELAALDSTGQVLTVFNAPAGMNTDTLSYRMTPQFPRPKRAIPEINLTSFDFSRETPHIRWARPLAGGRIKLLALTPQPALRELAELSQRLDVELHTLLWPSPALPQNSSGEYFGLLTSEDISANLDRLLNEKYDVILLAGLNCSELTGAQREAICRQLEEGCGLVEIGNRNEPGFLERISAMLKGPSIDSQPVLQTTASGRFRTFPFELLPQTAFHVATTTGEILAAAGGHPFIAQRQNGAGRCVSAAWLSSGGSGRMVGGLTPELPWPLPGAEYKDYPELYMLALVKMVLTAAGKDTGLALKSLTPSLEREHWSIGVELDRIPSADASPELELFIRNRDGEELVRRVFRFSSDRYGVFELPKCPWGGLQLLGVILRDGSGRVLDSGAAALRCPGAAGIASVRPDREAYAEGDRALFTITKRGVLGGRLRWRLTDSYGRVLESGETDEDSVILTIGNTLPARRYEFTAERMEDGRLVDRASCSISVRPAPKWSAWADFEPGIWLTPRSSDGIRPYLWPLLAEQLRKMRMVNILANSRSLDVDFASDYAFNPTIHHNAGTHAVALPENYRKGRNKLDLHRNPCLSNPEFKTIQKEKFRLLGEQFAGVMPRYYWFGDELSLTGYWSTPVDYCFSPTCLAGFRRFLLQKYGSLERLNSQWNTSFGSVDEALPETAEETRVHTDGNHSAWADHLEFMDSLLCDYIRDLSENGLRRGDSLARGFISGPQAPSAYGGNDWEKQSQVYSGLMTYPSGALDELLRSFHPEGLYLPWVLGYANTGEQVCYDLWKSMANGAAGVMGFSAASMVRPDFTLSPTGAAAARYLPEITDGIGCFFMNILQEAEAKVLIVYSQASIRAAFLDGRMTEHENLRWKYVSLCRNFGVPFRFVSDRNFRNHHARLIILPDIDALSGDSLAQLVDFVSGGGILLTEGSFAGFDESCRRRQRKLPDIHRAEPAFVDYRGAWLKQKTGRDDREQKGLELSRRMFASVLAKAGIIPRFIPANSELEIFHFRDRGERFYTLVLNPRDEAVSLDISDVWDLRRRNKGFRGEVTRGDPLLFTAAEIGMENGLTLERNGGGREFNLSVTAKDGNDMVFHLNVISPDGRETIHYNSNILAPGGLGMTRFGFALNDAKGNWTFQACEIVSGKTAELSVYWDGLTASGKRKE